jgi:hypothetical protein
MTSQPGYQRGDRIALVHTGDPATRLRPSDQGTVTRWDPAQGQFSGHEADCNASELRFYVACMSATQVPADDLAVECAYDCGAIHLALSGRALGDVGQPQHTPTQPP